MTEQEVSCVIYDSYSCFVWFSDDSWINLALFLFYFLLLWIFFCVIYVGKKTPPNRKGSNCFFQVRLVSCLRNVGTLWRLFYLRIRELANKEVCGNSFYNSLSLACFSCIFTGVTSARLSILKWHPSVKCFCMHSSVGVDLLYSCEICIYGKLVKYGFAQFMMLNNIRLQLPVNFLVSMIYSLIL